MAEDRHTETDGGEPGAGSLSIPRLLMLSPVLPEAHAGAARERAWRMLWELHRHFRVSLAAVSDGEPGEAQHAALDALTERVRVIRNADGAQAWRRVVGAPDAATQRQVRGWHAAKPFDAIFVMGAAMARYAFEGPRLVMDLGTGASMHARELAGAWPLRGLGLWRAHRLGQIEAGRRPGLAAPAAVTVATIADAEAYRREVCDEQPLRVVPHGVDAEHFHAMPDPAQDEVLIVGGDDAAADREALAWLLEHVWPVVQQRYPAARLMVAGVRRGSLARSMPDAISHALPGSLARAGARKGVAWLGDVADVREAYARCSVVVEPTRLAAGRRSRALEAMACQRAVVCGFLASRGIDAVDGRHLLVADGAADFADHVVRLLKHPTRRTELAAAARRRVKRKHDWGELLPPVSSLLRGPVPGERGEARCA